MGFRLTGWGATARVAALMVGCLLVANCSGGSVASRSVNPAPRVVEEGEPIPKGGGSYRVGKPYTINGRTYIPADDPSYREEGVASWYGPDFHGRLTANQEVYDMNGISAAHRTMPLPSYARVTNLNNGKSIVVRVNDRGPYVRNRVVDLSIGTAKALDFYGHGLARVRVEYVGPAPIAGSDDRMLLATLRDGTPAPAPSSVMIASAQPFLPNSAGLRNPPLPAERPFTLGAQPTARIVAQSPASEVTSVSRPPPRPVMRSPAPQIVESRAESMPTASAPTVGFAPMRSEGGALGLMSGRGLY